MPSSQFATIQALEQEMLLHKYKLYAALAFCRANKLNKVMIDGPNRRFGIVTCGKTYMDVRQALDDLGIDDDYAKRIGLSLYKVGMTWPLEREGVRHFAEGLEEILVVEEKRALMENQLKEQLYNWKESVRPKVVGKFDESGEWILPSADELTPARIARVIAKRIARFHTSPAIEDRLKFLEAKEKGLTGYKPAIRRVAYFCSGCPHNTSTKVPEGSRALAGIGCHIMASWMDRGTETFTQMGGEGATWIGQAPFSKTAHVFQNLGDGTYYHSGLLAIRAAVASGANITYKILFNDAVAMTGGQPVDGPLTVPMMAQQLTAEALSKITVVTDRPEIYRGVDLPDGVSVHHRDELDAIQREMREIKGVTAIIYDQTCAAEKRRRRKRGLMEDPAKRVFINEEVCEGCGDCSKASNCLSVIPLETAMGRKRAIDQSSCNKDYSCLNGFCPSFVTIEGGKLKKPAPTMPVGEVLPEPTLPALEGPVQHPGHRHRRHRRRDHRRAARHGGAPGGQGLLHHGHDRPGAEGRRGFLAHPYREPPGGHPRRARRRRQCRPAAGLRHRGGRDLRLAWPRAASVTAAPSSTAMKRLQRISPAIPIGASPARPCGPRSRRRSGPARRSSSMPPISPPP